jgi:hypothetical protein
VGHDACGSDVTLENGSPTVGAPSPATRQEHAGLTAWPSDRHRHDHEPHDGNTAGYKAPGPGGTGTVEIQDPSTAPTFTVTPRLTSSDPQYQLCIKCHSAYGTSTPPQTAFFASTGRGATQAQTDVARDINPYQLAYHPIAAVGRNQPLVNANAAWASSPGASERAQQGPDNTFVDGWGARAVACSDRHGRQPDDAWGPHPRTRLLKGIN